MRTTVNLDDELMAQASKYSGIKERSVLLRKALEAFVQLEAGRRLAALGGTMPGFEPGPRKRFAHPE